MDADTEDERGSATVVDISDRRRLYLTGEIVLARAERDPEFRAQLLDALDRQLTDPDDRALFGLSRNPPPSI
jgi:CRP-like cAMP-binding protein